MSERAFKVLLVFGTRPEAIKLALVLRELQASEQIEPVVCVSAQHDELLDQALDVFSIKPDYSLDVMIYDQSLFHITRVVLERIVLLDPPDYASFVHLMEESALILTDSGGIKEAGAALHIPLLVLRDKTDRVEGITTGAPRLVGTDPVRIVFEAERLLRDSYAYEKMREAENPYGDGNAAMRIAKIIEERYL